MPVVPPRAPQIVHNVPNPKTLTEAAATTTTSAPVASAPVVAPRPIPRAQAGRGAFYCLSALDCSQNQLNASCAGQWRPADVISASGESANLHVKLDGLEDSPSATLMFWAPARPFGTTPGSWSMFPPRVAPPVSK